ncbi:MAG: PQQ-binding-like beta-propeller repeat protein, partial [Planctomycetota bacterium]
FKVSAEKAERTADVKCPMDYSNCPVVLDGHAYVFGRKGSACISLAESKLVWEDKELKASAYIAPILADGKVFVQGTAGKGYGDGSLAMFSVSPEKGKPLSRAKLGMVLCTTPALADGRLYCRTKKKITCYDLRK